LFSNASWLGIAKRLYNVLGQSQIDVNCDLPSSCRFMYEFTRLLRIFLIIGRILINLCKYIKTANN
jgi:hypothetical protein